MTISFALSKHNALPTYNTVPVCFKGTIELVPSDGWHPCGNKHPLYTDYSDSTAGFDWTVKCLYFLLISPTGYEQTQLWSTEVGADRHAPRVNSVQLYLGKIELLWKACRIPDVTNKHWAFHSSPQYDIAGKMVGAVQSAACCLADWVDASLSSNFQETLPDDRMRHQAELHPAQGHKSPLC